jgi:hypothetical protein
MKNNPPLWKKGRRRLGVLSPLLGNWYAEASSPMGQVKCSREFKSVLGKGYVQQQVVWDFGGKTYSELTLFGMKKDKLHFWSFTSDGKNSEGALASGTDVHPEAICFEAQMDMGLARMIFWPDGKGGFFWAVESRNKKGWNRFTEHHYVSVSRE